MVKKAKYHALLSKQTNPENIIPDVLWVHLLHTVRSTHSFKLAGAELQNAQTGVTRIIGASSIQAEVK